MAIFDEKYWYIGLYDAVCGLKSNFIGKCDKPIMGTRKLTLTILEGKKKLVILTN